MTHDCAMRLHLIKVHLEKEGVPPATFRGVPISELCREDLEAILAYQSMKQTEHMNAENEDAVRQ